MPNISFDVFFTDDVINVTASRSNGAPKVKPEWKVRTAPKLPPKEPPSAPTAVFGKSNPRITELGEEKEKRKPPKLGPSKAKTAAPKAAAPKPKA